VALGVFAAVELTAAGNGASACSCIVLCHNKTNRIAVGMSAMPTRAEMSHLVSGPLAAGRAASVLRDADPARAFPWRGLVSSGDSVAKRSASAAMAGFDSDERLEGRPRSSPSPKALGRASNLKPDLRLSDERMTLIRTERR